LIGLLFLGTCLVATRLFHFAEANALGGLLRESLTIWNLIPPSLTGILSKRFATNRKLHRLVGVFVSGHSTLR